MSEEDKKQIEKEMEERERDFSGLSEIKKCPKCGGGLDEGYTIMIRGSFWNENKPNSTWKMPQQNRNQNNRKPLPKQKPSRKSQESTSKPLKNHRTSPKLNSRLCSTTKQHRKL